MGHMAVHYRPENHETRRSLQLDWCLATAQMTIMHFIPRTADQHNLMCQHLILRANLKHQHDYLSNFDHRAN